MIRKYRETTDYEKERSLPFNSRDMSRISLIVSMVKEMPDPVKAVEYFDGEHIFIDVVRIVYEEGHVLHAAVRRHGVEVHGTADAALDTAEHIKFIIRKANGYC